MGGLTKRIMDPMNLWFKEEQPVPKAEPVAPMADEAALAEARRREAAKARSGSGRVSTILSQDPGLFSSASV